MARGRENDEPASVAEGVNLFDQHLGFAQNHGVFVPMQAEESAADRPGNTRPFPVAGAPPDDLNAAVHRGGDDCFRNVIEGLDGALFQEHCEFLSQQSELIGGFSASLLRRALDYPSEKTDLPDGAFPHGGIAIMRGSCHFDHEHNRGSGIPLLFSGVGLRLPCRGRTALSAGSPTRDPTQNQRDHTNCERQRVDRKTLEQIHQERHTSARASRS